MVWHGDCIEANRLGLKRTLMLHSEPDACEIRRRVAGYALDSINSPSI